MLTVKYQNLSGDWFENEYPDPMGHVIYNWKTTGGVCQRVELWQDGVMVISWSK